MNKLAIQPEVEVRVLSYWVQGSRYKVWGGGTRAFILTSYGITSGCYGITHMYIRFSLVQLQSI